MAAEEGELKWTIDTYNGVKVETDSVPSSEEELGKCLEKSLAQWKKEKRRGIWLPLTREKVALLPLVLNTFEFQIHHATNTYFMCTKWLPQDCPNTLPPYSNTSIGVGGWVENDKGEVLVVQEKTGPSAGRDFWKLPGGLVDPGEDFSQAAVTEVLEETGISTEFHSLLCFQQNNGYLWADIGSMYAVCRLIPLSFDITPQPQEIALARWMPIHEFRNLPYYAKG